MSLSSLVHAAESRNQTRVRCEGHQVLPDMIRALAGAAGRMEKGCLLFLKASPGSYALKEYDGDGGAGCVGGQRQL